MSTRRCMLDAGRTLAAAPPPPMLLRRPVCHRRRPLSSRLAPPPPAAAAPAPGAGAAASPLSHRTATGATPYIAAAAAAFVEASKRRWVAAAAAAVAARQPVVQHADSAAAGGGDGGGGNGGIGSGGEVDEEAHLLETLSGLAQGCRALQKHRALLPVALREAAALLSRPEAAPLVADAAARRRSLHVSMACLNGARGDRVPRGVPVYVRDDGDGGRGGGGGGGAPWDDAPLDRSRARSAGANELLRPFAE